MSNQISQAKINLWHTVFSYFYDFLTKFDPQDFRSDLINELELSSSDTIIDVSAGTGRNAHYYQQGKFVCTDINSHMLKRAAKHIGPNYVLADSTKLSFPDNCFDAAIMAYALSAIPDNKTALEETIRVVKPESRIGIFDFKCVNKGFVGGIVDLNLLELISESELEIISKTSYEDPLPNFKQDYLMIICRTPK